MKVRYDNWTLLSSIIAIAMSYAINKSILWAIFHCLCSWVYVLYWLFTYTNISEFINSFVVYR